MSVFSTMRLSTFCGLHRDDTEQLEQTRLKSSEEHALQTRTG